MNEFPNELLETIIINTNYPTIKKIKYTCKLFHNLLKDDEYKYKLIKKIYNIQNNLFKLNIKYYGDKILNVFNYDKNASNHEMIKELCDIFDEEEYKFNDIYKEMIKKYLIEKINDEQKNQKIKIKKLMCIDEQNYEVYTNDGNDDGGSFGNKYDTFYDRTNSYSVTDNIYIYCNKCHGNIYIKDDDVFIEPVVLYLYKCMNTSIHDFEWTEELFEKYFDRVCKIEYYKGIDGNYDVSDYIEKEFGIVSRKGTINEFNWKIAFEINNVDCSSSSCEYAVDLGIDGSYFLTECCKCEDKRIVFIHNEID